MLWEIEITPQTGETDREAERILSEAQSMGCLTMQPIRTARSFLIEGELSAGEVQEIAESLLADPVAEQFQINQLPSSDTVLSEISLLNVLFKPGMTDNVAQSTKRELDSQGYKVDAVGTCRKYWIPNSVSKNDRNRIQQKLLANDSIERLMVGPLLLQSIALGSEYEFELKKTPLSGLSDAELQKISDDSLLSLSLDEMHTIQKHFEKLDRDPTDIELETIAQTWSEHCSHKTLAGRIRYKDESGERHYENMLKETIFEATQSLRKKWGQDDWCVSVFRDNAGIVKFNDKYDICFKVETHNRPSALEPYGGANTGIGGVIRDSLGTGLGGRPICNTDVFCFAPPETPHDDLPRGILHPKMIARGVVAGVRDYGNRMGIPTVNGSVFFDDRYLGNPLVYCGNVARIPVGMSEKKVIPGCYIVSTGGRTGLDGIHGATFSSAKLTEDSEETSGGAVQIGNAVTEKMVADAMLRCRDKGLYTALTDCGAGGFSSAVGEMGEETGAEVWLDKAPLKYSGLNYTEIWISEAQERMVFSVPEESWEEFKEICDSEGVEATIIGKFTDTKRLVLKYGDHEVADVSMKFLHDGRPPVVRDAEFNPDPESDFPFPQKDSFDQDLKNILSSPNVCSKEWIIRQYDHEVLAGSVVKPLVGVNNDGPSDAAVVQPDLGSQKGIVVSNGMNPYLGDYDPYWMAASAIDEAIRNCVAVGGDPERIAILDNFCWGNTDHPEVLGSLVRAAIGCEDAAIAFETPFISGKDSLHNEFTFEKDGEQKNVRIPGSLLISALGQIDEISKAVTMDLKQAGNRLYLVGETKKEFAGSHFALVNNLTGGWIPKVHFKQAKGIFKAVHQSIKNGLVESCHDLSEGGLAVASAEMAFAGGLGAQIHLSELASNSNLGVSVENVDTTLLFSESNSRFLIEVSAENESAFQAQFAGLTCTLIGEVEPEPVLMVQGHAGEAIISSPIDDLKASWQGTLNWS